MEIPNSLLEEQGRQMYAAKLMELQVDDMFSYILRFPVVLC